MSEAFRNHVLMLVWSMSNMCMKLIWSMFKGYVNHVQTMPETCPTRVSHISQTCLTQVHISQTCLTKIAAATFNQKYCGDDAREETEACVLLEESAIYVYTYKVSKFKRKWSRFKQWCNNWSMRHASDVLVHLSKAVYWWQCIRHTAYACRTGHNKAKRT